jgi:micrococcal nuclease
VDVRPPARAGATGRPSGTPGEGRQSRSRKWIWLGAGAAGLIGLAALGSAKLISTNQPAAAPVSPAPAAVNSSAGPVVTVSNVINGDTLEVAGQYSGVVDVLGIISPHPDKNQCGAATAKAFAVKTLNNATVTLITDPSQPPTDRLGHRLAFLRLPNGSDYSVLAVQAGMARYYDSVPPVATAADIKAAEAQAEKNHVGLWAAPCDGKFTSSSGTSTVASTGTSHSSTGATNTSHSSGVDSTRGTSGSDNG